MKRMDVYFKNEWFEDEVNEYAEQYAKQRVIEELENMNNIINDLDDANMVLQLRIKELKQEQS